VTDGADRLRDGARAEIIVPRAKGAQGKNGKVDAGGNPKRPADAGSAE